MYAADDGGRMPSKSTIRRALVLLGAKPVVAKRKLILSEEGMLKRLKFCEFELMRLWNTIKGKYTEGMDEKNLEDLLWTYLVTIAFTDEKIFTSDFGTLIGYIFPGDVPPEVVDAGRTACSRMCWMLMHANGVMGPVWVKGGTMDAALYYKTVIMGIKSHTPYEVDRKKAEQEARRLILKIRFQQDNAGVHKIYELIDALNAEQLPFGDYLFVHPPSSPDLNLIENLWSWMDRRKGHHDRIQTMEQLMTEVMQTVHGKKDDKKDQDATKEALDKTLKGLFGSWPRRLLACIAENGGRFTTAKLTTFSELFRNMKAAVAKIEEKYPYGLEQEDLEVSNKVLTPEGQVKWKTRVLECMRRRKKKDTKSVTAATMRMLQAEVAKCEEGLATTVRKREREEANRIKLMGAMEEFAQQEIREKDAKKGAKKEAADKAKAEKKKAADEAKAEKKAADEAKKKAAAAEKAEQIKTAARKGKAPAAKKTKK